MRNLIKFIIRYHFTFLFLIIELLCLFLVIQNNIYQRTVFFHSSNVFSGNLMNAYQSFTDYLSLHRTNQQLVEENARLHNLLKDSFKANRIMKRMVKDSTFSQQYDYLPAKVINNSIHKAHNYITLDKGYKQGVKPEMAVISPTGIIGIVKSVSVNFSTVISVLNSSFIIHAKLKKNNYFGNLTWKGTNYTEASLYEIPYHVRLHRGDTIVSSGYSGIFPEGILIGIISDYRLDKGANFYEVSVKLSTDFKHITYVYVVENLFKQEQMQIEKTIEND